MVRVELERRFARAWMTRAEDQRALAQMQKAAKAQELLAEHWLREPSLEHSLMLGPAGRVLKLAQTPQELRKRKPESRELPLKLELLSLLLENPRMLMQALVLARRAAEPRELAEHLPQALLASGPAQEKLAARLAQSKNNARLPRSPQAWAELGRVVPFARQAFPAGEKLLLA